MNRPNSIESLENRLREVQRLGFVNSMRTGPTGVGHTVATLLGLPEDNFPMPDLGMVELKAKRIKSSSPLTLMTMNHTAWQPSDGEIIKKYGKFDPINERTNLYSTISTKRNGRGYLLVKDEKYLDIVDSENSLMGRWDRDYIETRITQKISNLLLVKVDSKKTDTLEQFQVASARLYMGIIYDAFFKAIEDRALVIDIRMHLKPIGITRNHGTGFRARGRILEQLYQRHRDLLI